MEKPSFSYRAQEWAADNFKGVQYPENTGKKSFFKNDMPWSTRVFLALFGVFALVISVIALFFIGVVFYSIFTA